jgi:hypothetical protein
VLPVPAFAVSLWREAPRLPHPAVARGLAAVLIAAAVLLIGLFWRIASRV